jgi:hypothetical protein
LAWAGGGLRQSAFYHRGVEQKRTPNRCAALAGAVASDLNDELTVILNSIRTEFPACEEMAAVERATMRCALIAKGLMLYAHRHGARRPGSLRALLDDDLL